MIWTGVCKVFQKQSFDLLSKKYGIFIIFFLIFILTMLVLLFWEVLLSLLITDDFNLKKFANNIGGKIYKDSPLAIDVVYTWVNGSDPRLLHDLTLFRLNLLHQEDLKPKFEIKCLFDDCLKSNSIAIFPAFTEIITLELLHEKYQSFNKAINYFHIYCSFTKSNIGIIEFNNTVDFNSSLFSKIFINDVAAKIYPLYYTSDSNIRGSILADDLIILIGLPRSILKNSLVSKLYEYSIELLQMDLDLGQAILRSSNKSQSSLLINNEIIFYVNFDDGIITVVTRDNDINIDNTNIEKLKENVYENLKNKKSHNGKNGLNKDVDNHMKSLFKSEHNKIKDIKRRKLVFKQAYYIWSIERDIISENAASSRFEDHDELKYSLRSLDKNAPWVRQIFIVTNGQIPSWLNLNNQRIKIVTHKEIFSNISHLPTFSSPAIECHLHRIPDLAKQFIYFNDDVLIGQKISIDDFYTVSNGQKLYPTWAVPDCESGCPNNWLNDGYCDRACNNSNCNWDEGDCNINRSSSYPNVRNYWLSKEDKILCNAGCMDNWVADKYCDRACNVRSCAFDAGDCGVDMFDQLQEFKMDLNKLVYDVNNYHILYFNYSNLNIDFEDGYYEEGSSHVIRDISLAQSFKVLILILFENQTSEIQINLQYTHDNLQLFYNFTLLINTIGDEANLTKNNLIDELYEKNYIATISDLSSNNKIFSYSKNLKKYPIPLTEFKYNISLLKLTNNLNDNLTLTNTGLMNYILSGVLKELKVKKASQGLKQKINIYIKKFEDGDLTQKGLEMKISELIILEKLNMDSLTHNLFNKNIKKDIKSLHNINKLDALNASRKFGRKLLSFDLSRIKKIKICNHKLRYVNKLAFPEIDGKKPFRKLMQIFQSKGFLPWENHLYNDVIEKDDYKNIFNNYKSNKNKQTSQNTKIINIDKDLNKNNKLIDYKFSNNLKAPVSWKSRQLLDLFGGSLRYVGKIYDKEYGKSIVQRKVPAHMAHYFDKDIIINMQTRFPLEWDMTSSHKFRQVDDMQYAFSYFYFIVNEKKNLTIDEIFKELDTDNSEILSDREIRTLATRLFDLPLTLDDINTLEDEIIFCSKNSSFLNSNFLASMDIQIRLDSKDLFVDNDNENMDLDYIFDKLNKKKILIKNSTQKVKKNVNRQRFRRNIENIKNYNDNFVLKIKENYYNTLMPQVTLALIKLCEPLVKRISANLSSRQKYKHELYLSGEKEVEFEMLRNNISKIIKQLDKIRKYPRKFICLNDDIDNSDPNITLIKHILHDFYESLFPIPSQFELPIGLQNRYLWVDELEKWKESFDHQFFMMYFLFVFLLSLILLLRKKCLYFFRFIFLWICVKISNSFKNT